MGLLATLPPGVGGHDWYSIHRISHATVIQVFVSQLNLLQPLEDRDLLLSFEQQNSHVAEVEVDEVLCLCADSIVSFPSG